MAEEPKATEQSVLQQPKGKEPGFAERVFTEKLFLSIIALLSVVMIFVYHNNWGWITFFLSIAFLFRKLPQAITETDLKTKWDEIADTPFGRMALQSKRFDQYFPIDDKTGMRHFSLLPGEKYWNLLVPTPKMNKLGLISMQKKAKPYDSVGQWRDPFVEEDFDLEEAKKAAKEIEGGNEQQLYTKIMNRLLFGKRKKTGISDSIRKNLGVGASE
ncbi:MAG: hypothetical protein KGH62_02060 [Candidatus Micrarchaeota archaeon]|nr:hypothetical protein [Candidatus Micrarchaeota archaeon]